LAYLRDLGAQVPPSITKTQASDLIEQWRNKATDAQKRRLTFYRLSFEPDITKDQASMLIDSYRQSHPESEDAYQEWKITSGTSKSASPRMPIQQAGRFTGAKLVAVIFLIGLVVVITNVSKKQTYNAQSTQAQPAPSNAGVSLPAETQSVPTAQPAPSFPRENFVDERKPIYARITGHVFAETATGWVHFGSEDIVLVTGRNSKNARINLHGKTAVVPLSETDLATAR
jgi:hypothetical protein